MWLAFLLACAPQSQGTTASVQTTGGGSGVPATSTTTSTTTTTTATGTGTTVSTGTPTGSATNSCSTIFDGWAAQYRALRHQNSSCTYAADCHVLDACNTFYGCAEPVALTLTQQEVDDMVALLDADLVAAGCSTSWVTCDCYYTYTADCDAGHCVLTGGTPTSP